MSEYRTTMAIRMPNAPKVRVPADIYLQNGAQYTGQVFVAEPSRIQDLLNSPKPFLPFID
jgi:hypothetical protein